MKTKLILGSLLALTGVLNAQNTFPTSGNAGVGTLTPTYKLDIFTATNNDGIRIVEKSTGIGACGLYLDNRTSGGKNWSLLSTGQGDTPGTGRFVIFQNTSPSTGYRRFLIDSTGNIGAGVDYPSARFHSVGTSVGVRGDANGSGVAGNGIGSNNIGFMAGVAGRAYDGATNAAGWFQARVGGTGVTTYGVYSEIVNPLSVSGGISYGIYASDGGHHTSGAGPTYAGYFNGDVVTAGGSYFYSDKGIKKDIAKINNSLDVINKLNPVTYNFNQEANPGISLPSEKQYGFISQEIRELLPEFTKTLVHPAKFDENGKELIAKKEILGLNYIGFIALLTKGVQEQQQQITADEKTSADLRAQLIDQQKQLDEQKQLIAQLSQKVSGTTGIATVNGVEAGFQMSQNEPNPFSHETVVNYTLPQTVAKAFMAVYDLTGKQITTLPIEVRGSSSVTVTSEKLAAGIYIYSIVADGKVVDSKRMIVAEK